MEDSPLRNVSKKAGPRGDVGGAGAVVLRDTARSYVEARAWYVQRSTDQVETSLKLTRIRRHGDREREPEPADVAEITLSPVEAARLLDVLRDFLQLAGEPEGPYIVVPLAADPEADTDDLARKVKAVLAQPGVAVRLAGLGLTGDVAAVLHDAARLADLRAAIAELRGHLDAGTRLEKVYQDWCDRHSWAFGNAYVARDEVRHVAVGDQVDLLMESSANGLRDVFELKRPDMRVIGYDRSHKCWYWSPDTAKAIAQCHRYLDVLHDQLRDGLRDHRHVVAYHPRAFVVIGRSDDWDQEQERALHGLNARLHGIAVLTYDHLLAQAESLLATLSG